MMESLNAMAAAAGGNLVIERCPLAWKAALPIWGRPTADHKLMRRVKQTLDPKSTFNPGRFFPDL
jgi:glycolate oxidase FAD binding subunit